MSLLCITYMYENMLSDKIKTCVTKKSRTSTEVFEFLRAAIMVEISIVESKK